MIFRGAYSRSQRAIALLAVVWSGGWLAALTGGFAGLDGGPVWAAEPSGFKPIFNGQDLSGWEGDTKYWRVEAGTIVAESTPENPCTYNSFLRWADGEVDDFELKLEFRISGSPQANSGIQFRSQVEPDGHVVGYQADIDLAGKWLGACYDEKGRGMLAGRGQAATVKGPKEIAHQPIADRDDLMQKVDLNGWNSYHVIARGHEIIQKINGVTMSMVTDLDEEHRDFSGVLALQLHSGPPMKVEFRDIRLKRLPLEGKKKIVFLAGSKSHGYFAHEHNAGCQLLADKLNGSGLPVLTAVYLNGWPKDPTAFDNADTVVCYCDGGGRHILNPHLEQFDRIMQQGTGLVCLHYAVETVIGPEGEHFLKWIGGYFEPNWSVNPHWMAHFEEFPEHPITRGVKPFSIQDEWYYHMRFTPNMEGVTPILTDLPPRESLNRPDGHHSGNPHVREAVLVRKEPQHVAWAFERENGGRGFGFTGGHFHVNWQQDDFRKVVLNAIVWSAQLDVPEHGVQSPTPTPERLKENQDFEPPANWEFKPPHSSPRPQPAGKQDAEQKTSEQPLFASPVVTAQTPGHAVPIDVPIAGAKRLFLVVGDGRDGFACDWANWAEPRLIGPDGEQRLTEWKWKAASSDWGQVRINANAEGQPLKIDGQAVEYGIGTHANSVIEYELPEGHAFERFRARGGLDEGGTRQNNERSTSVQFYVFNERPSAKFLSSIRQAGGSGGASESRELEQALDQLTVADGLEAKLFAGEPLLANPTNIDIDARGRVWVCEVVNYRQFRNDDTPERKEGDRILILEDTNGDGQADSVKTFYQGRDVDSAHGICVLGNRVLISCGDSIFWLIDENGNDQADRKEVLFTGIGGTQHDHGIHACVFGPDGKLYFNFGNMGKQILDQHGQPIIDKQGNVVNDSRNPYQEGMVFRCNLDGSEFETLAWNFRNNWEVCLDSFGTMWQSDNDDDGNRGVRINYVMEFGNYGYRQELTGAGWREARTGMHPEIPYRHWHQNDPGSIPNLLHTGAGSPTGILLYEGELLPEVFRNQMIHCDAGPNIVRAYPVRSDGAGYSAEIANILEGTGDKWFRPSDVCIGPDGSLFVADWYDAGVGGHRMVDVERGRIFRIAPPDSPYRFEPADVSTVAGAMQALLSPNLATRYLGWTALQEFGAEAEPALVELFRQSGSLLTPAANPRHRARAFWALGKLPLDKQRKVDYLREGLIQEDPDLRITALRLARQLTAANEVSLEDFHDAVDLEDPSPAVRREMLIGLRELNLPEAAGYWSGLALQHDGEDRWYLEALGIAAHGRWDEFLKTWLADVGNAWKSPAGRDIIWRSRAQQTPELLVQLILDPETPLEELPRYFRSLDFNKPLDQELLAELAFHPELRGSKRADLVTTESLQRLEGLDIHKHPRYLAALNEILDSRKSTPEFVELVFRFKLEEQYPELLEMALKHSQSQLGVDAARALIRLNQRKLLQQALSHADQEVVRRAIGVLGLTEENGAVEPLLRVMNDRDVAMELRREAARAVGKSRAGSTRLAKLAEDNSLDAPLIPAVALVLHASPVRPVQELAQKLFPLPPAKDNEPLPPLAELAKQKGNAQNGRLVFHTHGTCAKCHQVNTLGKEVGPDLSEIGKKLSREALYESILYPSAGISHNYETYTLVTIEGNILTGLLVSESAEEVAIKNAEGIVRTVPRADVEELVKQNVSLMPADLQKVMSRQDLIDVVEYMTTLREKKQ